VNRRTRRGRLVLAWGSPNRFVTVATVRALYVQSH
jgi:hypothetical protein